MILEEFVPFAVSSLFSFVLVLYSRQFLDIVDPKSPASGQVSFYVANPPVGVSTGCDDDDLVLVEGQLL